MQVRVLGCSGAIARDCRTTSFLIDGRILIDAGTGVGDLTLDEMQAVDDVFLTHSHLDHIAALPLMLDAVGANRRRPLAVLNMGAHFVNIQRVAGVAHHGFAVIAGFELAALVNRKFRRGLVR